MRKYVFIIIILIIILSTFFFIKHNVQNNTELFYKYKSKIPLTLKYKIRIFLTKINNFYIYKKNDFVFKKRKKNIILNENISGDELFLFTNSNLIFTGPRAYFASNKEDLFLITGTGILMTMPIKEISKEKNNFLFKKINTNIMEFLSEYKNKDSSFSKTSMIKSLIHKNDLLLVSLVKKINNNCYKHLILEGKLDKKNILFKEFFKIDKCRIFYSDYVGGSLTDFNDDKILYTVGDWAICEDKRWLKQGKGFCTKNNSQSMTSALGKIYEINIYNKKSKIISIGHDNPKELSMIEKMI